MAIDQYIMSMRARLSSPSAETAETLEELRAHLEDTAGALQLAGVAPHLSEREAVRRCGAPDEVAAAMMRTRRARVTPGSRGSTRALIVALAIAAALAAIGGNAVASAHTTSSGTRGQRPAPLQRQGSTPAYHVTFGGRP